MKGYFKFIIILALTMAFLNKSYSTHVRAGEITFKRLDKLKYEIVLVTYTDSKGAVDREYVDIIFSGISGQNEITQTVKRSEKTYKGNNIIYNKYITTHIFPGTGNYIIGHFDRNRMRDIVNMDNSVNTPFYCETGLTITETIGNNRSPILTLPPIDFAQVGQIFEHNPLPYDLDDDSLVFTLIPPKQNSTTDVNDYSLPDYGNGFTLDQDSGQLVWNVPDIQGTYNIAILIEEFRHGFKIGYVIRDMQIIVLAGNNNRPIIDPIADTCILAGQNFILTFDIHAHDKDIGQKITLIAIGGPFMQNNNKAVIIPDPAIGVNSVTTTFSWEPGCDQIKKRPYKVLFHASDNHIMNSLTKTELLYIQVIGPAPENLMINSTIIGIELNWDPPLNCVPVGYYIYRKMDSSFWDTSTCEIGIPRYTGFEIIESLYDANITTYLDDNKGMRLSQGMEYCYRITAIYQKEDHFESVEGYASNEVCALKEKSLPIITHVSIMETDKTTGKIFLAWTNPVDLDTQLYRGPYKYNILRKTSNGQFSLLKKIIANQLHEITDTSLVDTLLNTKNKQYSYLIEMYCTVAGNEYEIGKSKLSTSIFLKIESTHKSLILNWNVDVPWKNDTFVIYRRNDATGNFDFLGYSLNNTYTVLGLENGKTYCYQIKSIGGYSRSSDIIHPIINFSQKKCAFPRDTIPPCPPELTAETFCLNAPYTQLNWTYHGDTSCAWDVIGYKIYYSRLKENSFFIIAKVDSYSRWNYIDERTTLEYNLAGCYVITAVDSYNNESDFSNQVCVDNCPTYVLPNVFSPNGDTYNEIFQPKEGWRHVQEVNMRIYNRWGQLVYQTTNPRIKWDGKDFESNEDCSEGTYFYICTIYELRLEGNKTRYLRGTITLIR